MHLLEAKVFLEPYWRRSQKVRALPGRVVSFPKRQPFEESEHFSDDLPSREFV